ncbi:DNA polymerase delta subunit 3-like [Temnothorax curvispinosus]|uniref:DNA polymerase delta subunit 3 n=1 Tax=Temnothorax curvispinosus TaxID=300111 RepID=A0A6J1RGI3_9HYME|nr:DNA polymerase delta subunit 3-like [Temnothorax curvispinosus]
MIMEALNEHLEALAGHVFDNDKLVTYKWLSKELHVHVNIAKQILWEFYQKYKSNNIECTYLLIGLLKDKGMRVEVVKESDVPKAKEKFSKIMSEHLYSVHKPLADLELLASSGSGDINYSAIKCDACKERSDEEMQLLRWGTAAKKAMENTTNLKSTNSMNPSKTEKNSMTAKKNGFNNLFNMAGRSKSPEKPKSSFQERDRDSMKKDNLWKKKDSVKNKDSTETDQALMEETKELREKEKDTVEKDKNFVQKDKDSAEKTKNSTEKNKGSKTTSTAKKVSPQSNSVKKGSLNNFFGKLTSPSKSIEVTSSEKKNDNAKEEFTEEKMSKEKKKLQGKKRNRSKETDEGAKKRKRIVIQNDSSDSEVQSDIEMEELVPETEPEILAKPKSPSPPRIKHENGKRKVLKLVNKTYKEGEYIVTKKEHVYVSCSEDEEEKEEEMRRKEKKAEAKIEKVKKKQSTLTDFFKRS